MEIQVQDFVKYFYGVLRYFFYKLQ
jgi:hypothetical protein